MRLILFLIFFHLSSAILVLRILTVQTALKQVPEPDFQYNTTRAEQLFSNLDAIVRNGNKKNIFFGYSVFQYFLDPRIFDQKMRERGRDRTSYNLAFAGHMGAGLLFLINRLEQDFENKDVMFNSIFFEFSPISYSNAFHLRRQRVLDMANPQYFLKKGMLIKYIIHDPPLGVQSVFDIHMPSFDLKFYMYQLAAWLKVDLPKEWPGVVANFHHPAFQEKVAWNIDTRGYSSWNMPRSKGTFNKMLANIQAESNWSRMLDIYKVNNSIGSNFSISQPLFDKMVMAIERASLFSRKTYILLLPHAPSLQKVLDEAVNESVWMQKILKIKGVTVIDLRKDLNLRDGDFADAVHPRHETMEKLLSILVEKMENHK